MVDFQETTVKFESSVVMEKCSLSCDTWKQFLLKEKCFCFFSSPEPLGSQGKLIVFPSSRRPSSS